ncbi:MAG: transcriptional regulator [Erysipelotrichaceae bacterium]|nr:transcriptional regulator [Erysipelotrichaceae bacterium]
MKYEENEYVELKESIIEDLEKEVVAFLNTHSGAIYIGVNKIGEVIGINNYDDLSLRIVDRLKNNITPSIIGLFEVNILNDDNNKHYLEINVASGIEKPYYIKKYGMSVKGCFKRIGTQSSPMEQKEIDNLYAKKVKNTLSNMVSPRQKLTFTQLKIYYQEKGYEGVNNEYFLESLDLYTEDHKFNYLAYLLSDNNATSIRVAKYSNDDFVERNEYGRCCLIKAINCVIEKLKIENKTSIEITGDARRKEINLVNPTALREAILNIFCHNDYSVGSEPYIIIYDDRIELFSYGGLPQGLSKEEFFKAKSLPRNRELMRVMSDLDMGEHLGRGMRRIMKYLSKKDFEITDNFITISFKYGNDVIKALHPQVIDTNCDLTEQEQVIIDYIKKYGFIRRSTVEDILNIRKSRAGKILTLMIGKQIIKIEGASSNSKYVLYQ